MEALQLTRIKNDVNGNGRYVTHFLNLNTYDELRSSPLSEKYALAVARANKIGGRRYHCKAFGGGIVFQSSAPDELIEAINRLTGKSFTHVTID